MKFLRALQPYWQIAVEPSSQITDPDIRQRARLFNGLLLTIIVAEIIAILLQMWVDPPDDPSQYNVFVLGILVASVLYILNRLASRFRLVSYAAMGLGFITILIVALESDPPHQEFSFLIFLPLVSTILFSLKETLFVSIVSTIFGLAVAWNTHEIPPEFYNDLQVFIILSQAFIIFVAQQRNRLEVDRQHLALEQSRNNLLTELLTNLSHDFRTPLSIINTSAYLLGHSSDPETRQSKIDQITRQTQRLDKILDDILTLSRLEQAQVSNLQMINLNQMLTELVEVALEKQKTIKIIADLKPNLTPVRANRDYLQRAFANILQNALQHTPAGGSITIRSQKIDNKVTIEVVDTGTGISEADLPLIFDHFFRGDKARSMDSGGPGLGLSIAKRAVELHRGIIEVESKVGKGSTFRVTFPVL